MMKGISLIWIFYEGVGLNGERSLKCLVRNPKIFCNFETQVRPLPRRG